MKARRTRPALSVGDRHFCCNTVPGDSIEQLLTLWKIQVLGLPDGASAFIALEWSMYVDEYLALPSLKCVKAEKQGDRVRLFAAEALDPIIGGEAGPYWLWTFSESKAQQLAWSYQTFLIECEIQTFLQLAIVQQEITQGLV